MLKFGGLYIDIAGNSHNAMILLTDDNGVYWKSMLICNQPAVIQGFE